MKLTINDFFQLTKTRLALSVVFSSLAGYFLAADKISIKSILLLFIGGYAMVGASNAFNQLIERNRDGLMKRTSNRPLPGNRITPSQVLFIGLLLSILGIGTLYIINIKTAIIGVISICLYLFTYTPLKIVTPLSVFVGAIPGAIPYMLGWVAYTNSFGIEPGILFLFQFFWQFPHFWALAWMFDKDYKKAGFKMLPTGKTNSASAFQIVFYSIWTVVISLLPMTKYTGTLNLSLYGGLLVFLCGLVMLFFALRLMKQRTNKAAKDLMYTSIFYLTSVQIIYILDKF
ncbi:MAG: heme o synthase [Flavobacteriaceae bacterium]|nr:heme o synthase [Flavobacteriaceae bacterium]